MKIKQKQARSKPVLNMIKEKILSLLLARLRKTKKEIIEKHYKNKGYKSMSEYLFALIDNDINSKN